MVEIEHVCIVRLFYENSTPEGVAEGVESTSP